MLTVGIHHVTKSAKLDEAPVAIQSDLRCPVAPVQNITCIYYGYNSPCKLIVNKSSFVTKTSVTIQYCQDLC